MREISTALTLIDAFGSPSGFKFKRNKTEGLSLGELKHCKDKYEM